jgi:hypothetical protein
MKSLVTLLIICSLNSAAAAGTFYDQLCEFNFNWKKYSGQAPEGESQNFSSDKGLIQAHLKEVLRILHANPTAHLSVEQKASRSRLLHLLAGYRAAGNFPVNYCRGYRVPVFIDEHNTYCAVGYLMKQSGQQALALRIAAADNYVYVKDIHDPELPAWQNASGFSTEELALIQGAYDFYMPNALYLPNRYETPQMPICTTAYFTDKGGKKALPKKPENIWCRGEGKNGVPDGRWEQNFAVGVPWITGCYENGKRTGKWEEYYQGTTKLCRTEHWKNDKLNGIRERYDMNGNVIEKIIFQDGKAVTKVNFDLNDSLVFVRTPLDSVNVWTEVFTAGGKLIARGHETIYNPGNLQWFQNIELTALNSFSLGSRSAGIGSGRKATLSNDGGIHGPNLYNAPPLVEYKKQGDWKYYPYFTYYYPAGLEQSAGIVLSRKYSWFYSTFNFRHIFNDLNSTGYDSVLVQYEDNKLENFYGYSKTDFLQLHVDYYKEHEVPVRFYGRAWHLNHNAYDLGYNDPYPVIKRIGQFNGKGQRIGEWKYFNAEAELTRTENYVLPLLVENDHKSMPEPGPEKLPEYPLKLTLNYRQWVTGSAVLSEAQALTKKKWKNPFFKKAKPVRQVHTYQSLHRKRG